MVRLPLFLFFLLAFVVPSYAQNLAPVPAANALEVAPITVAGRRLFDVGPSGTSTALQRATRVNRRLQNLVEQEAELPTFSPDNVTQVGGEQVISLGDISVLTITQRDAEDAGQEARELALVRGTALSRAVREARASRENLLRGAGILISNSLRDVINSFFKWLPRVFAALLLASVFWVVARMARTFTTKATRRFNFDANLRDLFRAMSYYGVWFVGILAILSVLGLDSSSLAAAVGVSGFVLGFAFKDILSHFLAGILLLVGGKFRIGDQIVVREFEGTVERIELRALELRTYDNRLVIIPNGDVFSAAITSNTASPHRRSTFCVPIPHEWDLEKAQRIITDAVKNTEGVLETPTPDVVVDELTKDTVVLRARFSTVSTRSDYVRVGSDCMRNVKLALAQSLGELKPREKDESDVSEPTTTSVSPER